MRSKFRKIVSNLPFSPGLLNNLSFYSYRLRQERVSRQIGIGFLGLAFALQAIFWLVPPVSSIQAGNNDIVWGGIGTNFTQAKATMLRVYDTDADARRSNLGISDLMTATFGITRKDIESAVEKSVDTRDGQLKSIGRNPYNKPGEVAVRTPGGRTYYLRPINVWPWRNRYQPALYIPAKDVYILYSCGNLVTRHYPTPQISITKSANKSTSTRLEPGDKISYTLTVKNTGNGSATDVIIKDPVPRYATRPANQTERTRTGAPDGVAGSSGSQYYYWRRSSILPGTEEKLYLTYTVSQNAKHNQQLCNRASVDFDNGRADTKQHLCHRINAPEPQVMSPPDEPEPPIEELVVDEPDLFKRAENISAPDDDPRRQDANQTTAYPGEKIRYVLSIVNNTNSAVENYQIPREYIGDILDYADLAEHGSAQFDAKEAELYWDPITIKPNETIEFNFVVQVKDPIPTTPQSESDPAKFDLVMTNVFGNLVEIRVPTPPEKIIEQTSQKLPNTGPGTIIFINLVVVSIATFLKARTTQLRHELGLVKKDYLKN